MAAYEMEKTIYPQMISHAIENGQTNGSIKGLHHDVRVRHRATFYVTTLSVILNVILLSITIISVRDRRKSPELCPAAPTSAELSYAIFPTLLRSPVACCPNGWIGYQGKCYYFSVTEGDWMASKTNCSSFNASLSVIDSQEEMDFMRRYKGVADHWVGLQRDLEGEPWKWINGTSFNNWFEIRGGGECAYMNHKTIASSSCTREEPWICSKLAGS
ncbi:C-type lectin domain family 2 member B-like [Hemicordylus capensis]|uniref:C-type lectin domain family 2 member B-like n=1 Tax=Hemicordylus capensis TaxID=884348 RepID=UPI002304CE2F|nr:C-type lectin domain family 2 member B-like [Hemicordylus capensis]